MKQTGLREIILTTLRNNRHLSNPTDILIYEDLLEATKQIHEGIITGLYWVAEQSTCKEIMIYLLEKHIRAWESKHG